MKHKYQLRYYFTLLALIIVLCVSGFGFYKINKTLELIHTQMADKEIQQYIDAGWMPPLGFMKTKKPKLKQEKN